VVDFVEIRLRGEEGGVNRSLENKQAIFRAECFSMGNPSSFSSC